MTRTLDTSRSPIVKWVIALALIVIATVLLDGVQSVLSRAEGHVVRPFEMGYLLPVAFITLMSGRVGGLASLVACSFTAAYFLMPGHGFRVDHASDVASLGFLALTGIFMIAAVDTAKRNYDLRRAAQARAGREGLLAQVARMSRSSADPVAIQKQVMQLVAQHLNADRAYLVVRDDAHSRAVIYAEWHRPDLHPLSASASASHLSKLLSASLDSAFSNPSHRPMTAVAPSAEYEKVGLTSMVHVPLASGDHSNAIFGVAMSGEHRVWTEDEITLAEVVSAEMRAVVTSARMMQRERNIANTLQAALLPQPHCEIDGLDTATYYNAALAEARIGGDFCDIFPVRGTEWALVVGDVSGKGLRAASQIATVRNMLRTVLYLEPCISCSIGRLNAMLTSHGLLHGFVTLFAAIYDSADRTLTFVNCGHDPALLLRADGTVVEMNASGPILGVIAEAVFKEVTLQLGDGDVFMVYTDGASEAGPNRPTQLGVDGLTKLLLAQPADATCEEMVAGIAAGVHAFAEGNLHDDVCLLVARPTIDSCSPPPPKPDLG